MQKVNTKIKPVRVVPFTLYNIEDYFMGSQPVLHPDFPKYDEFWMQQLRYCLEGKWGYDYDRKRDVGGYRWMPGNLYFYINMGIINMAAEENQIHMSNPLLRDIEWLIFYGLAVCDGFSGFADDPDRCCFLPLRDYHRGLPMSVHSQMRLDKYGDLYRKRDGSFKDYVEPKEYLYKVRREPAGRPMYHNTALNFELLSTRRLGKSFIIGQGVVAYDFVFNGARTVEDYLGQRSNTTVVIGAADYRYSGEFIDKFEMAYENIRLNVGSYYKDANKIPGCFWHPIEGMGKGFKNKGGIISNSVTVKSGQGKSGAGSKIVHVSYKDNANAGVGYGARKMIIEEVGLLSNFEQVHSENSATQKHDEKYGSSYYIGTGGNVLKIQGVRDSFYNPEKYDILSYPNLFNPGAKDTALFVPVYYKNNNFRDENGNLDIERSFLYEMEERDKKRGGKGYVGHTISFPMVPGEMFMKGTGNRFNGEAIENRIMELEEGEHRYSVGRFFYVDQENRKVVWEEDVEGRLKPFLRRGDEVGKTDLSGAVVIYEHPQPYRPTNRHTNNPLYITLYDTVFKDDVNGSGGGTSLCALITLKLYDYNDSRLMLNVVAEWYGRYKEMNDNHRMAFMMCDYYNSMLLAEVNDEDILRYANKIRRYQDLADRPGYVAADMSAGGRRKYVKGFAIPPGGKAKLEEYLDELLETVVYKEEEIVNDEYTVKNVRVIDRMPSLRVCEELRDYNPDENFDAVSCMFLGALYIRNKILKPIHDDENTADDMDTMDFIDTFTYRDVSVADHPAFNY